MAQEVMSSNVEMWLPSELFGDDFFMEEKQHRRRAQELEYSSSSASVAGAFCFPYDCDSNLSSPLESEESDEEDHLNNSVVASLTKQMARSYLLNGRSPSLAPTPNAFEGSSSLACSPQSPLCTGGMLSDWGRNGSAPFLLSSPPTPHEPQPDNAWDLLYAAAGQVRNMNLSNDVEQLKRACGGCGLLGPPRKPSSPHKNALPPVGFYCYDGAQQQHHAFQNNQLQQLKQQQHLTQQQLSAFWSRQNRIRPSVGLGNTFGVFHPQVHSRSTWPPLPAQQPPPPTLPCGGSGMRAVFLGANGVRKKSSGTGVFLPRRAGSPAEPRKKPACSTVLVPAKVVQALNLHLEGMGAHHPRYHGGFFVDHDTCSGRSSAVMINQKSAPPALPVKSQLAMSQEMRLPPEWTY